MPLPVVYGTGSLTATFANGSQTATGSLTLLEGTNPVSTAALSANIATFSLATLALGQHTLVATYAGDAANAPIASGVYLVNVTQGRLLATANPIQVLYGQPIPAPTGGFFGQPQQTYTTQVVGTATTSTGTIIQHATTVTLTIQ